MASSLFPEKAVSVTNRSTYVKPSHMLPKARIVGSCVDWMNRITQYVTEQELADPSAKLDYWSSGSNFVTGRHPALRGALGQISDLNQTKLLKADFRCCIEGSRPCAQNSSHTVGLSVQTCFFCTVLQRYILFRPRRTFLNTDNITPTYPYTPCSFHFIFHCPNITSIYCSSFHFLFHYPQYNPNIPL